MKSGITEEGATFILLHNANKDNINIDTYALCSNTGISEATH